MTLGTDAAVQGRAHRISLLSSTLLLGMLPWPTMHPPSLRDLALLTSCCIRTATAAATPASTGATDPAIRPTTSKTPSPRPSRAAAEDARLDLTPEQIAFGDRLRTQFTETVAIAVGRKTEPENVVATMFPRLDLSGEVTVAEDGSIAVPKLGRFAARGRALADLQADLATAFQKSFGRPCDVDVAITDRKPVYVLGDVRAPGVFKYSGGMIVMNILASAGGTAAPPADSSRQIENIRESERLQKQRDLLNRLLIKQARLSAQRQNLPAIILPPSITAQISSTTSATTMISLISSATVALTAARNHANAQRDLAERQVAIAQTDIRTHAKRGEQLRDLLAKKQTRLSDLRQLASRGSVPQYNVLNMEIDVSDTALRLDDEALSQAQAERREVETEAALEWLRFEGDTALEAEWAATMQDIEDCNQAIQSIGAVVQITAAGAATPPRRGAAQQPITITRRMNQGLTELAATDSTTLIPGDIVQVGTPSQAAAPERQEANGTRRSAF